MTLAQPSASVSSSSSSSAPNSAAGAKAGILPLAASPLPSGGRDTTTISGSLPHKALAAAIDVSLRLPQSQPVALLAGFYRGQHFRQAGSVV